MNYFSEDEFKCKCGCGLDLTTKAKDSFIKARELSGTPYNITSGARCLKHNKAVGSKSNSAHIDGLACDISFSGSGQKFKIIRGLILAGFKRIGINDNYSFIHADLSKALPNEIMFKY